MAHFLLENEADDETIKHSYEYYEEITTHDSSLSYCLFSIMASKLGDQDKAYRYFQETARLDLDNMHGNTKDGLHMASMGGAWLAMVYGFAGLRISEEGIAFSPSLPEQWQAIAFKLSFRDRELNVQIEKKKVVYLLLKGKDLTILHKGNPVDLTAQKEVTIPQQHI